MKNLFILGLCAFVAIAGFSCRQQDCGPAEKLPPQCSIVSAPDLQTLAAGFSNPVATDRAWVYWFIMDGNLSREGITADLEAMHRAGIGGVIFLEVDVGVERGPVDFMSPEWVALFKHACEECKRLDISLTLISGPGWTGSGGPWVEPENSMHFIVGDTITVRGGERLTVQLPRPKPRLPYFGLRNLNETMQVQREAYYKDLFVLAYPKTAGEGHIDDIERKALYARHPYSSDPKAKPFLAMPSDFGSLPEGAALDAGAAIDLTEKVTAEGMLEWDAPAGEWIVYRFGQTITGANTRPAPHAGVGFEASKMDTAAFNLHLDAYIGELMKAVGKKPEHQLAGWNMLHIDSWEMGTQNWSDDFYEQFRARRGYDPKPFLPAMTGQVVESPEVSERFLWDMRVTVQELILENHARHLRNYAHRHGFGLSIEPYDMSPSNDIALGGIADVPMCETWEVDENFNTAFSCIEAVSAANLNARPIVGAEAFTSHTAKFWQVHPGNMKNQTDWAFCIGINRMVFHRYAHQPWTDRWPGMTMGPYGMNYERTQTWWELSQAWHDYLARSQYLLRQGRGVADILFLTPEGNPHSFVPPEDALEGTDRLPDKKGYNFDGCDPGTFLEKATVRNGRICFPGGMEYRLLVLPTSERMTPAMLAKIERMIRDGASVMGFAPKKSPSLTGFPEVDSEVAQMAAAIWGDTPEGGMRKLGKGQLFRNAAADTADMQLSSRGYKPPYPKYEAVVAALRSMEVQPDFESDAVLRYIHRHSGDMDIYMVSNPDDRAITAACTFRVDGKKVSLWDAASGGIARGEAKATGDGRLQMTLPLEAYGSVFVIFSSEESDAVATTQTLWPALEPAMTVTGPWQVAFQAGRGAPAEAVFAELSDWSRNSDPGIRYFSGIAEYTNTFVLDEATLNAHPRWFIDLGDVEVMARVEINGNAVTELWKAPFRCEITPHLKPGENQLWVQVANQWPNRLTGDQMLPAEKRVTFTTHSPYTKDSPLLPSGLLGPVQVLFAK